MLGIELKQYLENGNTCALSDGEKVVTSTERGIKPLLQFIESGDFRGCAAADKIVGKAAAFLYAVLGVSSLYAEVLSKGGEEVCRKYGIAVKYGVLTDKIINRKGDGICPMEQTVENIDDAQTAYAALLEKVRSSAENRQFA